MVESRSPLNKPVLDKPDPALKDDLVTPKEFAFELELLFEEFIGCSRSPKPSSPPMIERKIRGLR